MKGFLANAVAYDAAVFYTEGNDELIPFEIPDPDPDAPGRRFFQNAGRTDRRGFELGLTTDAGPLRLGASYSYSDFEFADFVVDTGGVTTVNTGNRIPGIPKHQGQGSVTWIRDNMHASIEGIGVARVMVNDANSASAPGYGVFNVRFGGRVSLGGAMISPVVGLQNIFDKRYVGSVSVNANANLGRYFEPAPGRTLFAALTLESGR
jgi:iron complex outermembrane receptor protein